MKKVLDFNKNKSYQILEAIEIVKRNSSTKFISSIDIAIKLNLDTAKTEQQLRGTLSLPYFFGKKKKILVLDSNLTKNDAKSFEVDFTGGKEVIDEISKGWLAFDLIITTPKMMPELSKLGKILGTRGLMPSPKNGNVTTNLKKTIADFKSGITQYRTDSYGNVHILVGKTNADDKKIEENINFILDFLKSKKPSVVKGIYIQNVSISSTMGPGVKITIQKNVDLDKKGKSKQKTKIFSKKKNIEPIIKLVYEKKDDTLNREKKLQSQNLVKPENIKKAKKIVIDKTDKIIQKAPTTNGSISKLEKTKIAKEDIKKNSKNNVVDTKQKKTTITKVIDKPLKQLSKKTESVSVVSKKITSAPTNDINKKKNISKIKINKVDDNKVQTNKKITKKVIKSETSSKKVTPRKIEIKKINNSK